VWDVMYYLYVCNTFVIISAFVVNKDIYKSPPFYTVIRIHLISLSYHILYYKPVMRQFSRDRGRGRIDEAEAWLLNTLAMGRGEAMQRPRQLVARGRGKAKAECSRPRQSSKKTM